jgi:hypothetical protein
MITYTGQILFTCFAHDWYAHTWDTSVYESPPHIVIISGQFNTNQYHYTIYQFTNHMTSCIPIYQGTFQWITLTRQISLNCKSISTSHRYYVRFGSTSIIDTECQIDLYTGQVNIVDTNKSFIEPISDQLYSIQLPKKSTDKTISIFDYTIDTSISLPYISSQPKPSRLHRLVCLFKHYTLQMKQVLNWRRLPNDLALIANCCL